MLFTKHQLFSIIILLYSTCKVSIAHKCILNPFYHPICGSDMKTYGNKDILACVNHQRPRSRQIRAIYNRECDPLICPSMQDLQGPWPETAPICANNGYTYGHIHQVRCLRDFQPGIKVLHEGGCSVHEVYRALGRNPHEKACAERRRTFEINPICTVQNKSFSNPFMTICQTSRPTREKIGGTCGSPIQKSCEFAHRIQQSLMSAPASERTRFIVCGSDLRTYRSEHHLECSRRYNQYLYLTHHGRCENFNNICPEKLKYVNVATPVCGSDKHSYISFDALICARYRMNKNLTYLHSGACIRA